MLMARFELDCTPAALPESGFQSRCRRCPASGVAPRPGCRQRGRVALRKLPRLLAATPFYLCIARHPLHTPAAAFRSNRKMAFAPARSWLAEQHLAPLLSSNMHQLVSVAKWEPVLHASKVLADAGVGFAVHRRRCRVGCRPRARLPPTGCLGHKRKDLMGSRIATLPQPHRTSIPNTRRARPVSPSAEAGAGQHPERARAG